MPRTTSGCRWSRWIEWRAGCAFVGVSSELTATLRSLRAGATLRSLRAERDAGYLDSARLAARHDARKRSLRGRALSFMGRARAGNVTSLGILSALALPAGPEARRSSRAPRDTSHHAQRAVLMATACHPEPRRGISMPGRLGALRRAALVGELQVRRARRAVNLLAGRLDPPRSERQEPKGTSPQGAKRSRRRSTPNAAWSKVPRVAARAQ